MSTDRHKLEEMKVKRNLHFHNTHYHCLPCRPLQMVGKPEINPCRPPMFFEAMLHAAATRLNKAGLWQLWPH